MSVTPEDIERSLSTDVYQLPRDSIDIPTMVERAQSRLVTLRRQAVFAIFTSPIWGGDYPSVKSFPFRTQYRGYSRDCFLAHERVDMLEPNTGAINIPSNQLAVSELGSFFTPLRTRQQGDFTELRGLTYYTALDFSKDTPAKKLDVMKRDIVEGLNVVAGVDRKNLGSLDYLLYLGILDHLKFHSLTAFHALTFYEREGIVPDDADYLPVRQEAQGVMSTLTRAYYQACMGQSFDAEFNPAELEESVGKVADYIAGSGHSIEHFRFPEVINPLIIMLGSHEAARRKPYPDTIIGIPSGGTEVAVATALMYENLYPMGVPDTKFVPLSFHYKGQGGVSPEKLVELITQLSDVSGKHVLIVDDNSNSGSTLQRMSEAVIRAGANQRSVHIAEIDPARLLVRHRKEALDFGVVNMDHPDLETAMGMSGASGQDGSNERRRWVKRLVKKEYERSKKTPVTSVS